MRTTRIYENDRCGIAFLPHETRNLVHPARSHAGILRATTHFRHCRDEKRSDVVRKELAGLGQTVRAGSAYGEGLYRGDHTKATYDELLRRAGDLLGLGESVILDASWTDTRWRSLARRVADEAHADVVELCCTAPAAVAARRLEARGSSDASDATPDVAAAMALRADPWPEANVLPTTTAVEASIELATAAVDA